MNTLENLQHIHVSWGDLVRMWQEKEDLMFAFRDYGFRRSHPPIPAGTYTQSSVSDIVDEARGIKTLGRCYTQPSFEIKLVTS